MAFMDYLPQFGENVDQSGVTDPTLQAINLKRKLALADSLRNTPMPQGQMIGNRYVAPSWTQYLAGAVDRGMANVEEQKAMKEYAKLQEAEKSKLSQAFNEYIAGKGPKDITTTQDNFVAQPLQEGANVPTSPFQTNEQVGQISPNYAGQSPVMNMSGNTMVNQPITSTTQVPRTKQELMANALKYINATGNTDLASKAVLGDIENMFKAPETNLGKVEIKDYTPASVAKFKETGNYNDLVQTAKPESAGSLEKDYLFAKSQGYPGSVMDFKRIAESDKAPSGYVWSKDANGQRTLTAISGGPADKSQILKPVPTQVSTGFIENQNTINKIDNAIQQIQNTPDSSFGLRNVVGDTVMQRIDPKGSLARAAIAGVAGQKYHDISGAAVSASESNRLKPYIPSSQDTKENILQKLNNMKAEYANTNSLIQNQFNEGQGYRPLQEQNIPINSSSSSQKNEWKIEKVKP
jgi:hypothetical protein